MQSIIAQELARRRQARGMTQEALAGVVGVDRNTVGNWEAGRTEPGAGQLVALAGLFECSVDDLVRPAASGYDTAAAQAEAAAILKTVREQLEAGVAGRKFFKLTLCPVREGCGVLAAERLELRAVGLGISILISDKPQG